MISVGDKRIIIKCRSVERACARLHTEVRDASSVEFITPYSRWRLVDVFIDVHSHWDHDVEYHFECVEAE